MICHGLGNEYGLEAGQASAPGKVNIFIIHEEFWVQKAIREAYGFKQSATIESGGSARTEDFFAIEGDLAKRLIEIQIEDHAIRMKLKTGGVHKFRSGRE